VEHPDLPYYNLFFRSNFQAALISYLYKQNNIYSETKGKGKLIKMKAEPQEKKFLEPVFNLSCSRDQLFRVYRSLISFFILIDKFNHDEINNLL
jgi:hypothetical protein